jgi:hypothetical protein
MAKNPCSKYKLKSHYRVDVLMEDGSEKLVGMIEVGKKNRRRKNKMIEVIPYFGTDIVFQDIPALAILFKIPKMLKNTNTAIMELRRITKNNQCFIGVTYWDKYIQRKELFDLYEIIHSESKGDFYLLSRSDLELERPKTPIRVELSAANY